MANITRLHKKIMTNEHLEKRSGIRNGYNGRKMALQLDIELDGQQWSEAYAPLAATDEA